MQVTEILCVVMFFALGMFLTTGSYVLQRDRYWRCVWERLGEPEVRSIKELKAFNRERIIPEPEYMKQEQVKAVSNL